MCLHALADGELRNVNIKCITAWVLACASQLSLAQDRVADSWDSIRDEINEITISDQTVGWGLMAMRDGLVFGDAYGGWQDLETQSPVNQNTIFHWASVTKTLTAVALMNFVNKGAVDLDAPIQNFLPSVRDIHNPYGDTQDISLRLLITHTSGFRAPTFPWKGEGDWVPHEPKRWSQVESMMPYTEIEFPPGERYGYSNLGLSMLGRVIEIESGEDYETFMMKAVLMPLAMNESYFDVSPAYLRSRRAAGYVVQEGSPVQVQDADFDTGATVANGGLSAPISDIAKWLNFLLNQGDQTNYQHILPRQVLNTMWVPNKATTDDTVDERMGMSFFVISHQDPRTSGTHAFIGHTGGQRGFAVFIYFHPETNTGVIFASNSVNLDKDRRDGALVKVRQVVFDRLFPLLMSAP